MTALLGALLGFLSSLAPDLFRIYRERQDKAHEIAILKLQMEGQTQERVARLEEIGANADIAESQSLYKTYRSGVDWVDALNGTVRPILAYSFFALYAYVKIVKFQMLPDYPLPWQLSDFWDAEDSAIFAGIISFYFGSRALGRARQGK